MRISFGTAFIFCMVFDLNAQAPKLVLPIGHTSVINSGIFSPDGKKILTTSLDYTAKLWDAYTGKLLVSISHVNSVKSCFSPDGNLFVTADREKIRIWNTQTAQLLFMIEDKYATDISFSPDGRKFCYGYNHGIKIWDVFDQKELIEISRYDELRVFFSADGKKLIIIPDRDEDDIEILDANDGKSLYKLLGYNNYESEIIFSLNQNRLITKSSDSSCKIWDLNNGKLIVDMTDVNKGLLKTSIDTGGNKIITVDQKKIVRISDIQTGKLIRQIPVNDHVNKAAFLPDGNLLITTPDSVIILNSVTGKLTSLLKEYAKSIFSVYSNKLLTYTDDLYRNPPRIWDLKNNKPLLLLRVDTSYSFQSNNPYELISVSFSPDGNRILTQTTSYKTQVWNATNGTMIAELRGYATEINHVSFSGDGKMISVTCDDKMVKIWDVTNGKFIKTFTDDDDLERSFISPLLTEVLTINYMDGSIRNFTKDKTINLPWHKSQITDAAYSPDGMMIVTVSDDSTARLIDPYDGELITTFKGHKAGLKTLEFAPDGKKFLTSAKDSTVKVWSLENGKLLFDLKSNKPVDAAVFFPNGKKILTGSLREDFYQVWDAESGKLLGEKEISNSGQSFFSKNNKYLLNVSRRYYKIWDLQSGLQIAEIAAPDSLNWIPSQAAITDDGRHAIIGCYDKDDEGKHILMKWDVKKGSNVIINTDYKDYIWEISVTSDGKNAVTASMDSVVKIWDIENGKQIRELNDRNAKIVKTPQKTIVITGTRNLKPRVWDLASGRLLFELSEPAKQFEYSPSGNFILTSSIDNKIRVWKTADGRLQSTHSGHNGSINSAVFSSDEKLVITSSVDHTARIWETRTGKLIQTFVGHSFSLNSAGFSADNKWGITTSNDSTVKVWDLTNGNLIRSIKLNDASLYATFANEKNIFYSLDDNRTLSVWDVATGEKIKELIGPDNKIGNSFSFSPDGKKIVTTANNCNFATIWDAQSWTPLSVLRGHSNVVHTAKFSPDGKKILTFSDDNIIKIWNAENGKLIYSFFPLDSTDYFVEIESGYYQTTTSAAKHLHYVTKDLDVISFEQLDVKYNRPDKVLKAMGSTDTLLIKSYEKAYKKRIRKLNIDTTAFREGYSVPEADFANRDAIEYEQKSGTLTLNIKGNDSTYKIDRFNVWINETPIFGQRGINIRKRNNNDFDSTITIKISQGENRIETSITNVNGTESYRMPLVVNYLPAIKQKETTRFIGIGIDQFADNQYNLQYSSKDIRDLSKKLKEKYKDDIIIDTLFNENVTVSNVKALKQKLQQTTENDKVIIAYSGHGMLSKDYDYYLSTYAVNFNKPEENGLPYDELENLLDSIPARKKLMLIDACHSGEVDKEDLVTLNASSDSLIKGLKPVAYKQEGHLGLKNSFELMQSLFVNVGKSTGATIISAAAGTQFALERNDLKNGVFTYSILEAINKYPTLKISELKKIVGERVEELTKGLQKPTSRNETIAVDWNVW